MCSIALDSCSVWDENWRNARKGHNCSCCGKVIAVGEKYPSHFSVFERESTYERCCGECDKDRDIFAEDHGGQKCTPGYFIDMLRECIAEDDESAVWKLEKIKAR